MDHRWDESTSAERDAREEEERFGSPRIERDLDVERRDELRRIERIRSTNLSPWAIGTAWYDQRDTYTRNAEVDASGYARGPSYHPPEGSYAYHRNTHPSEWAVEGIDASLYEREAWPWLVYTNADPYFAHLHDRRRPKGSRPWQRLTTFFARLLGRPSQGERRSDARIRADAADALWYRGDLDSSDIELRVERGDVTLEGTVPDRRSRRIAAEVIGGVRGVRHVHNRLKVQRDDSVDTGVGLVPVM